MADAYARFGPMNNIYARNKETEMTQAKGMDRVWSKASEIQLSAVHPHLIVAACEALVHGPYDFAVIEGMRTKERQQLLVRQGASRTMNSRHLHGLAIDLWPIDPETGKRALGPDGKDKAEDARREKNLWKLLGGIAETMKARAAKLDIPLTWGGNFNTFPDGPHFELPHALFPNGVAYNSKDPHKELEKVKELERGRTLSQDREAGEPMEQVADKLALVVISAQHIVTTEKGLMIETEYVLDVPERHSSPRYRTYTPVSSKET